jgi:acyl-CoA dehydrogenase
MSDVSDALDDLVRDLASDAYAHSDGEHADVWPEMIELGLSTVGIAEDDGGSGGTMVEAIDLAFALGRHALSTPYVEHSSAVVAAGAHALRGSNLATVALAGPDIAVDDERFVSGQLSQVPSASHADHLVLIFAGNTPRVVTLSSPGVAVESHANAAGEGRDTVRLDRADSVPGVPSGHSDLTATDRVGALRAAALTGAISGAYATTRRYVNQREQFGAPLVKIPAVAANLAVIKAELIQAEAALESLRRCVEAAQDGNGSGAGQRTTLAVASARVIAARAASVAARVGHQLHGAMGITMEYPLHRHTRRLWAWRDDELAQHEWSARLTELADSAGEASLWDLTAP